MRAPHIGRRGQAAREPPQPRPREPGQLQMIRRPHSRRAEHSNPWPAVAATIALAGDQYGTRHDPLHASVGPPSAVGARHPAGGRLVEYAFQPARGSCCGLARGSAFGAPSARGHGPMGRSLPGPFPCSGSRPAAAARTGTATERARHFFFVYRRGHAEQLPSEGWVPSF